MWDLSIEVQRLIGFALYLNTAILISETSRESAIGIYTGRRQSIKKLDYLTIVER
jgi:hypothetical protein